MIGRLCTDSRRAGPGVAFLAYPGERADGRAHIADAAARGAAAVLFDPRDGFAWPAALRLPHLAVRDLKGKAGALAHELYGRPSEKLWICGVTGTNGKTSCTHWIASLLPDAKVIGTLGSGTPGSLQPAANTTPDAVEIQTLLKAFVDENAKAVAMEVSSHGLVQGRVQAVAFDCALFTNLSHDHLDYHGSMESYAEAKGRLFDMPGLQAAVLNLDDVVGVKLARRLTARGMRTIGYSLSRGGIAPGSVTEYACMDDGAIESSWGRAEVTIGALGRFNVSNALGVLGCLVAYGMPFDEAARKLERLPAVPGRMERIGDAPLVLVDYAHTPDALEKVLQALRPVAAARGGRLAVVFGAGGDRDASKRPLMGAIAGRLADRVVLTSDNPRGEDPLDILAAIRGGLPVPHEEEADRARAIALAVRDAADADVVLIAGKGHETYQEVAGVKRPFSDADEARKALARRGA
ncbi:MAG TPA: UDP-N-acetylmuramoyl-L-alanyl-D-glutamate--2,6-diaminopimelate ligase [Burkholderiales bacterium]|nr:UDP-N-acetylmuramoyl-L-alanyl-D-glutamate--2,6-diaminopimelate ligase [Burkholderiales bacterium]